MCVDLTSLSSSFSSILYITYVNNATLDWWCMGWKTKWRKHVSDVKWTWHIILNISYSLLNIFLSVLTVLIALTISLLESGMLVPLELNIMQGSYKFSIQATIMGAPGNVVIILPHYNDVIVNAMASQITSLTIVCSTVYLGRSKKISKLRVTGLCAGNSPVKQ